MPSAMLSVKVVPGASRNRIAGPYADGIKLQVAAAPERGKANQAVVELLAEWLEIPPGAIELVTGHTQPRKTFRIQGLDVAALTGRIATLAKQR